MSLSTALDMTWLPLVKTGRVYHGNTGAAGVAPPVFSSTAPTFLLYNPKTSKHNAVILRVSVGYVSGTMEAGHWVYASGDNLSAAAPTSTTAATVYNALVGHGVGNTCGLYTAATVGAGALTYLQTAGWSQVPQTASSTNAPWTMVDYVGGLIVVQPGGMFAVGADAVSSAFVQAAIGLTWYEDPVV